MRWDSGRDKRHRDRCQREQRRSTDIDDDEVPRSEPAYEPAGRGGERDADGHATEGDEGCLHHHDAQQPALADAPQLAPELAAEAPPPGRRVGSM